MDWGTSNFRAFRLNEDGAIVARRCSPRGILRVEGGQFAEVLVEEVGDWLAQGEKHILLCGMIGSRQGWIEGEYLRCPIGTSDLANSVSRVPFPGADVRLIPGVLGADADGIPEMMRGEETEAVGVFEVHEGAGLVCLPGTHSKWVHLRDRRIMSFLTCMTGEVYSALRKCTILGRMMTAESSIDEAAFLRGVARSADSGGLLHHIFGVRTLALANQLDEELSASYLSGLLIGHEARAVMPPAAHVHLVGAAPLCSLYAQAIEACGGTFTLEDEDAAARGLAVIGRRLKWT
ncbi:MAG TPA: 2-dehydro-3-deoxygalactonokinase [Acidobacteriaceae bacterium]|nr:2-dehydro-3-deoxygalactonokinase [Acidobacteriaceae bacterium]